MAETPPPGLAARRSALTLLDAVLRQGQPLDAATPFATRGLPAADRALAVAIASEVCRWRLDFDALIDSVTHAQLPDDAKARMVLRIALAQRLQLETPAHAVIATALPLLAGGPRRLAHGVLGTLFRRDAALPSVHTLPETIRERWAAPHGAAMVEAAAQALVAPPPLDISLKEPSSTAHWAEKLGGQSLLPGHVRVPRGGDVAQLAGYTDGAWWVQDLAASLPARLLGAGSGRTVLDIGAAPGGKTMQLAAAAWSVTALDTSARRLQRLATNLERTGQNAEILRMDALKLDGARTWDAVLLDAPCSATGIFRRHPDVLHRITPKDIADRVALQSALLDSAASVVSAGGTLVYAVCSLELEEGATQIAAFLARSPDWRIEPVKPEELPEGLSPNDDGTVATLPCMLTEVGGLDGFYMARLVRN